MIFTTTTILLHTDQTKNDYLLPYKKDNVMGLMHSRCSMLENLIHYKNDRYYCKLSCDTKQREPVVRILQEIFRNS